MEPSINVLGQPLQPCSTQPLTGFYRDGYCNTSPADAGSHVLAAQVTDDFLKFSASRGNDLRPILKDGCRWCLCASRWFESVKAFRDGQVGRESVPK
ncbi:hypothetical protein IE81DRAFT_321988 [Ceraceosorus guamensis]|uniref:Uncharacterized protein n=1 Tax=Ceraceosorus guamensis TaxID=1522189 RepID=A0A316W1S6_9BASI|nr:hypothetical protein IE81DRAFT_321988 [Ceraceosorus guamensis]PWN43816.1 hypothetical protein IE81DRAFT_321988 [Ceraceosorus guamensis]